MRVVRADLFAGQFAAGVRTESLHQHLIFAKRELASSAVDGGAGSKDKLADPEAFSGFEQVECPQDVGLKIEFRIQNRRTDPGTSGEMNNDIGALSFNDGLDLVRVTDVGGKDFGRGFAKIGT